MASATAADSANWVASTPQSPPPTYPLVGQLVGFAESGQPLVQFPNAQPTPARSTVALPADQLGSEVVCLFESGDWQRPLILGIVQAPQTNQVAGKPEVWADGQRVEVEAEEELTLRCGEASITLTKAGKLLLRGTYISSRSSGVQRIKGGSVQIN